MPELPEVELFRTLLLPLKSSSTPLSIELTSDKPPRSFISSDDVDALNNKTTVVDVLRKGKLICMVLQCKKEKIRNQSRFYLFVHMGMTGRISTPTNVPKLVEQPSQEYPPKYTHIKFKVGDMEACFSDPRKFGSIVLSTSNDDAFEDLADDALDATNVDGLVNQRLAIKALLLDQKRVMCGVGNWVADEVLYQSHIHPEQKYLTEDQANALLVKVKEILNTAIECLLSDIEFPPSWLFHERWKKRSATSGSVVKDSEGRKIAFVTAGGRTSAVVPSIQKLKKSPCAASSKSGKTNSKAARASSPKKVKGTATDETVSTTKQENKKRKTARNETKVTETAATAPRRSSRRTKT